MQECSPQATAHGSSRMRQSDRKAYKDSVRPDGTPASTMWQNCVVAYTKTQSDAKRIRPASGLSGHFCHQLFNCTDPLPGVVEIQQQLLLINWHGDKLAKAPAQLPEIVVVDNQLFLLN